MGQPHKHAEIIKGNADGKTIQERRVIGEWYDMEEDDWVFEDNFEYRIKPEPPKYPETSLTADDMAEIARNTPGIWRDSYIAIANAAIARAIEDGDVVPEAMLDKVAEVVVEAWAQDVTDRYPGPDGYSLSESEKKSIKKTLITRLTPVVQLFIRKAKGGA